MLVFIFTETGLENIYNYIGIVIDQSLPLYLARQLWSAIVKSMVSEHTYNPISVGWDKGQMVRLLFAFMMFFRFTG